jgi:hypothetical protein
VRAAARREAMAREEAESGFVAQEAGGDGGGRDDDDDDDDDLDDLDDGGIDLDASAEDGAAHEEL